MSNLLGAALLLFAIFGPPACGWALIRSLRRKTQRELDQLAYEMDLARCTAERARQLGQWAA